MFGYQGAIRAPRPKRPCLLMKLYGNSKSTIPPHFSALAQPRELGERNEPMEANSCSRLTNVSETIEGKISKFRNLPNPVCPIGDAMVRSSFRKACAMGLFLDDTAKKKTRNMSRNFWKGSVPKPSTLGVFTQQTQTANPQTSSHYTLRIKREDRPASD